MHDPYAPPSSEIPAEAAGVRMYTPMQVAAGAALGGPFALLYFLWANFRTLARQREADLTALLGLVFMAALVAASPHIPENVPNQLFTLAYMLIGHQVAVHRQLGKQAILSSPLYRVHSNWRVVGLGLLCLVISAILLFAPMVLLGLAGIWDPLGIGTM
jgi:hypothetical protein